MSHYPVLLSVAGRRCVVIGGGDVATRKALGLLEEGARVTVVSPHLTQVLAVHAASGRIEHLARAYRDGDLRDVFLAYAATDDDRVHERIASEAAAGGILLNVVDRPHLCNFIVPAVLRRGDLQIAVSSGGNSPALAARLRDDLDAALGDEYEEALRVLGRLRQRLRDTAASAEERHRIFTALVRSDLLACLRRRDHAAVDCLLAEFVGSEVTLASLGVTPGEPRALNNGASEA